MELKSDKEWEKLKATCAQNLRNPLASSVYNKHWTQILLSKKKYTAWLESTLIFGLPLALKDYQTE